MSLPGPETDFGVRALDAVLYRPSEVLVGLDFDGTLAPIIDDPEQAYANPEAVSALGRLGRLVGKIAVITGRPARTAVKLGGFAAVDGLRSMVVLGQYGVERWNAATDEFVIPPEPEGIAALSTELPQILADLGLADARVEHKGRAIGVHTRELAEPGDSLERLTAPLSALAERHGLLIEPGKNVLEIRAPGIDKGDALRDIVAETGARTVIFAGDDLGDLPAFRVVQELREEGLDGLLICSASHEEDALAAMSDLVLCGSKGVAEWLNQLADELEATQQDS
jgi:trehalose 6-phosphate phosphatase